MTLSRSFLLLAICIGSFRLLSCQEPQAEVAMSELDFKANEEGKVVPFYEGKPFTGFAISLHPNGNKHISQHFENGYKSGVWIIFYEDGDTQKLGYLVNGLEDGLYKEWYSNGQLRYKYLYKGGKKTGKWKSWYESGVRWTERDFVEDQLNGKVLVFDTDGGLAKEYTYINSELTDRKIYNATESPDNQNE